MQVWNETSKSYQSVVFDEEHSTLWFAFETQTHNSVITDMSFDPSLPHETAMVLYSFAKVLAPMSEQVCMWMPDSSNFSLLDRFCFTRLLLYLSFV